MSHNISSSLMLALLGTCATAPSLSEHKNDSIEIDQPADSHDPRSRERSRRLLANTLALIRESKSIKDFTFENITYHFGAGLIKTSESQYGLLQRLSDRWLVSYAVDKTGMYGPRFEVYFQDEPLNSAPPMTEICDMDFDEFNTHLESMGFARQRNVGTARCTWLGFVWRKPKQTSHCGGVFIRRGKRTNGINFPFVH